jgi:hypothetical protein
MNVIKFPNPRLTPDEILEAWDLILRTEPMTPELARKFCSEEGGLLGLTEAQVATRPRVLNALRRIRSSFETWGTQQTRH